MSEGDRADLLNSGRVSTVTAGAISAGDCVINADPPVFANAGTNGFM
jgi:hypothetical protein